MVLVVGRFIIFSGYVEYSSEDPVVGGAEEIEEESMEELVSDNLDDAFAELDLIDFDLFS